MLNDIDYTAAALYDGGWRSSDRDQLAAEYGLDGDDLDAVCAALKAMEL